MKLVASGRLPRGCEMEEVRPGRHGRGLHLRRLVC
jgi:hypothetical protein